MKYFLDTEFHEYKKKPLFCKAIDTIELISIGIVSEDIDKTLMPPYDFYSETVSYGREYYAICKEFDLKAAWNDEWLRENVLYQIHIELSSMDGRTGRYGCFKDFKRLINKYGKTREQIAEEIKEFVLDYKFDDKWEEGHRYGSSYGNGTNNTFYFIKDNVKSEELIGNAKSEGSLEFYGYYADYDHVCLAWLYGRMINFPNGFPQYTKDIQQMIDDNSINKELLLREIPQINCHNSLQDAIWNKKAYNWIVKQLQ